MTKPSSSVDPLLPTNSTASSTSRKSSKTTLIACTTSIAFVAVAFLFLSTSVHSQKVGTSHKPKLKKPVVILVSCDGFRFGYQHKIATPNIHRLIAEGTEAETGLIPVFPTATFPNHYSIVTGLYPAYHGIINNRFVDPDTGDVFHKTDEPHWWLGEPLWQTVVRNGLKAATCFWPGSNVVKGYWDCSPDLCMMFNESVPFEDRVNKVLGYFDLPSDDIPSFMTLYFQDPDAQGHKVGPDHPSVTEAIANVDAMIGNLIDGLEKRGIFEDVHVILVGDHGMVGTCDEKLIFLDDLKPWITIPPNWVQDYTPVLFIRPKIKMPYDTIVARMNEGLKSGKVNNGKYLKMYLKEDLPARLHYYDSDRITPIIGLLEEGFKIEQNATQEPECAGDHGYDNAFFSMRTIFIGHGPMFSKGRKFPSFENVQIYNVITSILGIDGAPNNGTASFVGSILKPEPRQSPKTAPSLHRKFRNI